MSYIDSTALKKTLSLTGLTYADDDIAAAIVAAEAGIDNLCHRKGTTSRLGFEKDADALQVRYFTPVKADYIDITDLVQVTSIQTDPAGDQTFPNTWATTDYALEPLNAASEGWPSTRITVRRNGAYVLPVGYVGSVKVTAQFGWPAIPSAITQATTHVAGKLLKLSREGVEVSIEHAVSLCRNDKWVMFLCGPYMKHRVAVG